MKPKAGRKRVVKAWVILIGNEVDLAFMNAYPHDQKEDAQRDCQEAFDDNPGCTYVVQPATLTYTEPTRPKRRARRKANGK